MSTTRAASTRRLTANAVFALASIALLAWTDWLANREAAVAILLAVVGSGVVLFREEIVQRLGLAPLLEQVPAWLRPILAAVPAVLYFLVRGQGASGAGGLVLLAAVLTVFVAVVFGRAIDAKLADLYRTRNRVLPVPVRLALALVLPVLIGFLVINGSLSDLPALFGGSANTMASSAGREGLFLLGTLLSAAVAFLLVREASGSPTAPVGATAAATAPAPWTPTHTAPPEGAAAWGAPDPTSPVVADIQAGLPLRVVGRAGDWAQVQAENGWTGWVDARRLVPRGSS